MQTFEALVGKNGVVILSWALMALIFLVVVGLIVYLLSKLIRPKINMGDGNGRGRPQRLAVTDSLDLDRQGRRLVILRRDNVEHLVMIGGPNDILIEQNIIRGERAKSMNNLRELGESGLAANADYAAPEAPVAVAPQAPIAAPVAVPVAPPAPAKHRPQMDMPSIKAEPSLNAVAEPRVPANFETSQRPTMPSFTAPEAPKPAPEVKQSTFRSDMAAKLQEALQRTSAPKAKPAPAAPAVEPSLAAPTQPISAPVAPVAPAPVVPVVAPEPEMFALPPKAPKAAAPKPPEVPRAPAAKAATPATAAVDSLEEEMARLLGR